MRVAAACALVLAALLAGCGGDDEDESAEAPPAAPATTGEQPPSTAPGPDTRTGTAGDAPAPEGEPEPDPSDPNAEEPVRSEAVFTGRGGRITPRRVNVPPFIAVRVILESADGSPYELSVEGSTLTVGGGTRSASVQLDGLQPQGRYTATANGQRLVVSASAEPGP